MEIGIYIQCFSQMYDDTFNPLGIQGWGVRPPHEGTFFGILKTLQ